jgi:hypothetical protein
MPKIALNPDRPDARQQMPPAEEEDEPEQAHGTQPKETDDVKKHKIGKLPLYILGIVTLLVALYLITPSMNSIVSGFGHQSASNATKSSSGAQLSQQEQSYAHAISANKTDAPAIFRMMSSGVNATQQLGVSYSGDLSISVQASYTNLTYSLPFELKFHKYGNDTRVDLSGKLISTLFRLSQIQGAGLYGSNASISLFKIGNASYSCVNDITLNSTTSAICQSQYDNSSSNSSVNGSITTLPDLNPRTAAQLFDALNVTSSNTTSASYGSMQCDFLNDHFSTTAQKIETLLSKYIPSSSPSQFGAATINGRLGACISYGYHVPLNASFLIHISNSSTDFGLAISLNETSIGSNFSSSYVTQLPAPVENYGGNYSR